LILITSKTYARDKHILRSDQIQLFIEITATKGTKLDLA